jgi:SPX domain protein involved in polyphosphate accumulation
MPKPSENDTDLSFIKLNKATLDIYSQITNILKNLQLNAEAIRNATTDWEEKGSSSESEKPRWSESDEAKYGMKLNRELRRSHRVFEDLKEQEEKIKRRIGEVERLSETVCRHR